MFLAALLLSVMGVAGSSDINAGSPLSLLMLAGGTFTIGCLLIPGIIINLRVALNRPGTVLTPPILHDTVFLPGLVIIWLASLILGQLVIGHQTITLFFLPILTVICILLPIIFYLRIALRGLKLPSARQGWTIIGGSLLVSPSLALIFEGLVLVAIFIVFMIYANFHPSLKQTLQIFTSNFQSGSLDQENTMQLMANLLFTPVVAVSSLGLFSIVVPIIEETMKIILILPIINRINAPVNGYFLGILCGAAFAFSENIGFASSGSSDWMVNILVRSTAALPHIFNSGLLGWGLVSVWQNHRYWDLGKTFLAVILIHGTWNAISLGFTMNLLSPYKQIVPQIFQFNFSWLAAWAVFIIGILFGLFLNNRQIRKLIVKNL